MSAAATVAAYDLKAEHARACLHWLTGLGVKVLSIHCYEHLEAPQILVASGCRLTRVLPAEDLAWIGQRHGLDGRIEHYAAHQLGCVIRWQEEGGVPSPRQPDPPSPEGRRMTLKPPPIAARKTRIKAGPAQAMVPQNAQEANAAVAEIGAATRALRHIEADMNEALAQIKEQFETVATVHRERIDLLTKAVQIWAEAHRDTLTQHGKVKTHDLPAGQICWRTRPPSVRVTGVDAVLDLLRRLGLDRFIRRKEEINREAILNEPAAVAGLPGLTISQVEDFVVSPFEIELNQGGSE